MFIRRLLFISTLIIIFILQSNVVTSQERSTDHFKQFKKYIGKTWRGVFAGSTPEKPVIDVSKWELILNGSAIRILHSLNDGEYGGETIIIYDHKKESLKFFYFTTGGFYTTGTISFEDEAFISHEYVTGNADGITEVKAVSKILPDGRMFGSSEYLKDGKWIKGHEVYYEEAPDAKVIFKKL